MANLTDDPLLEGIRIEAPLVPDFEPGQLALPHEPVDRDFVNAEEARDITCGEHWFFHGAPIKKAATHWPLRHHDHGTGNPTTPDISDVKGLWLCPPSRLP